MYSYVVDLGKFRRCGCLALALYYFAFTVFLGIFSS